MTAHEARIHRINGFRGWAPTYPESLDERQVFLSPLSPHRMGASSSKPTHRGLILTFDALGTLYNFRSPVAEQYLQVARQCGLTAQINEDDLQQAFTKTFKVMNKDHPNYGRKTMNSPSDWWHDLVEQSFCRVTKELLPDHLGSNMYDHFSSSAAYRLYPDVKSLFARLRKLRTGFTEERDPFLITGVISNSDPRTRDILMSLGLRSGDPDFPSIKDAFAAPGMDAQTGLRHVPLPWKESWDVTNDFDFVASSYDCDSEKPDRGIFDHARGLAALMPLSRAMQIAPPPRSRFDAVVRALRDTAHNVSATKSMTWIHVGDDYVKDYEGASSAGLEALHLVRAREGAAVEGAKMITSLTELAAVVNFIVENDYEVET